MEQSLGRVALPAVGAVQRGDQPGRVEPVQARDGAAASCRPGRRGRCGPCRGRPAGRASSASPSGIHSGCSMTARYMSATHSAPSGPVWMHRRPEPVVGSRPGTPTVCSSAARRLVKVTPVRRHDLAVDEVVDRLADEGVAGERRAEQVVAVDDGAARRGEVVGRVGVVEARQRPADRDRPARRRA